MKDYPVIITEISCYRKKVYFIEKQEGQKPQYLGGHYPMSDIIFAKNEEVKIPANGHINIPIHVKGNISIPQKVIISIHSSHGPQKIKYNKIDIYDIGKMEFLEKRIEVDSKWAAMIKYSLMQFNYIIK